MNSLTKNPPKVYKTINLRAAHECLKDSLAVIVEPLNGGEKELLNIEVFELTGDPNNTFARFFEEGSVFSYYFNEQDSRKVEVSNNFKLILVTARGTKVLVTLLKQMVNGI